MNVVAYAGLSLLLTGSMLHAQEASMKGLTLGGDLKAAAAAAGLDCIGDEKSPLGVGCHRLAGKLPEEFSTLGGQPVLEVTMYGFDGKLGMIAFTLRGDGYSAVKDAIGSRYGDLVCKSSTVRVRAGVEYDQEVCEASNPLSVLRTQKRASRVDQSTVRLMSSEYRATSDARAAGEKAKAKSDI